MTGTLIAITGASGFVGRHLAAALEQSGYRVRRLLRRSPEGGMPADAALLGDYPEMPGAEKALEGVDAVVHCAGIAHATSTIPDDAYDAVNHRAALRLAGAATSAGVRRYVLMSSVRAQSGPSALGVLTETDIPHPTDAYGRSKLAAERGLESLEIGWVALRPVLVYGPGVKGNMQRLAALARSPFPLPLAGLSARRSLVSLDSLTAAVARMIEVEEAPRRALLVADDEALTMPQMIAAMRSGLSRQPRLFAVPRQCFTLAGRVLGEGFRDRFLGDLVVDPAALRSYGWRPVHSASEGLARMMAAR